MTHTLRTSCTRDCPDACGLIATVDSGKVTRLSGDPEHPITRGFLCYRIGTHFLNRHHSRERLTQPLLRKNGNLVPVEWDEAMEFAARSITLIRGEYGSEALLHVQGGGSLGILKKLNALFSRMLGTTRTRGSVCDGAGSWANVMDFGARDSNDIQDLENARAVVLWGKNVTASSPHTAPLLHSARKRGASIWLIDPLPHATSSLADRLVQPRPGGDAALAMAIARALFDQGKTDPQVDDYTSNFSSYRDLVYSRSLEEWASEADVNTETVLSISQLFSEQKPVTSLLGWGLQRRRNGATQVRAINALHALSGNIGIPGAGSSFTTPRTRPFDLPRTRKPLPQKSRSILLPRLGQEILEADDPPIRGVLIDNANPVATNPDSLSTAEALKTRDFVMVIDSFLTDTAKTAHLVLPTTNMLEEDDLVGSYGHHFVGAVRPVTERLPGTRSDLEIYQDLARRLELGEDLEGSATEWVERMLAPMASHDVTRDSLLEKGGRRDPRASHIAFEGRQFPTPSGRFRFLTNYIGPGTGNSDFPLRMQALSTRRWQTSQLTEEDEDREGDLCVTLHPVASPGIRDGEMALLESRLGSLNVVVRHNARYRKDTVYVPRARSLERGRCVNALIEARLTDFGEGCDYYDEGVRLRPLHCEGTEPKGDVGD